MGEELRPTRDWWGAPAAEAGQQAGQNRRLKRIWPWRSIPELQSRSSGGGRRRTYDGVGPLVVPGGRPIPFRMWISGRDDYVPRGPCTRSLNKKGQLWLPLRPWAFVVQFPSSTQSAMKMFVSPGFAL